MKNKIIAAAAILLITGAFYFAGCKEKITTDSAAKDSVEQQIDTEHYIMNGKYHTVRKSAPDIENDDKALINRQIEIALQIAQQLEKYIPEEYKAFSQEKFDEIQKEIVKKNEEELEKMPEKQRANIMQTLAKIEELKLKNAIPDVGNEILALFYNNLALLEMMNSEKKTIETILQRNQELEKYIPEEYREFSQEKFDKMKEERKKKYEERKKKYEESKESREAREKMFAEQIAQSRLLHVAPEDREKMLAERRVQRMPMVQLQKAAPDEPKGKTKAFDLEIVGLSPVDENSISKDFYNDLAGLERMNGGNSRESGLRYDAYKAKAQYYLIKNQKNFGLTGLISPSDVPIFKAYRAKAQYYFAKHQKDFGFSKLDTFTPFEVWQNRIVVPGVKKTVKMKPSGFIVPDVLYNNLEKIKIKKFKINENDINIHVPDTKHYAMPAIKHYEYYSAKGNIAGFGIDLFYFEFDKAFPSTAKGSLDRQLIFLQTAVEKILRQRQDVSSCSLNPNARFSAALNIPDNGLKDVTLKANISYQGEDNNNKSFPEISGTAVTKGKKAWVMLTRGSQPPRDRRMKVSGSVWQFPWQTWQENRLAAKDEDEMSPEDKIMTAWYLAEGTDLYVDIDIDGALFRGKEE